MFVSNDNILYLYRIIKCKIASSVETIREKNNINTLYCYFAQLCDHIWCLVLWWIFFSNHSFIVKYNVLPMSYTACVEIQGWYSRFILVANKAVIFVSCIRDIQRESSKTSSSCLLLNNFKSFLKIISCL